MDKTRRAKVGKIKDHYHDFLEKGGTKLGFSMSYLPEADDIEDVLVNEIDAQVYSELKKEESN